MDLIAVSLFLSAAVAILMMSREDRKPMTTKNSPGRTMKVVRPAARDRMRFVNVFQQANGDTLEYHGLWVENRRGGVVFKLTPRSGYGMRSVN